MWGNLLCNRENPHHLREKPFVPMKKLTIFAAEIS